MYNTDPTYKEWKLEEILKVRGRRKNTDPTYKEWKLISLYLNHFYFLNTDPTYKEWKQMVAGVVTIPNYTNTDPTYKEWKHGLLPVLIALTFPSRLTRILPTRNGN